MSVQLRGVVLVALLLSAASVSSCKRPSGSGGSVAVTPAPGAAGPKAVASIAEGLTLRLTEPRDETAGAKVERVKPAEVKPLADDEAKALVGRMKPMLAESSESKSFALRPGSLPAPRTGATVQTPFPPPEEMAPPKAPTPPTLEVTRFSPEGDVEMAPNLSVTFSQPMIAVTSHADSIAAGVPVKLSPQPKGKWRWIGTQTLLFDPARAFPKSTVYQVEVPAGATSALGQKLAAAKTWKFSTPPLRLQGRYPSGSPYRRDVLVFLSFDQAIDAEVVAGKVTLAASGKTVAHRRATQAEIDADETVKALVKSARPERFVVLKPGALLDADTSYTVTVPVGTPSKEGPRLTSEAQTYDFRTYAPLKIEWTSCTQEHPCPPPAGLVARFNNPLDEEAFDAKKVTVSPPIADLKVEQQGTSIMVYGKTKGRTTYTVSYPAGLADKFRQTLGSAQTRQFWLGSANPRLFSSLSNFAVLDPSGDKSVSVYTINQPQIQVRVYAVGPEQWKEYLEWAQRGLRQEDPKDPPGTLKVQKIIEPKAEADEMAETRIALKETLDDGHGQRIVVVQQHPLPDKVWERQYVSSWVQVTDLGLDAQVDDRDLLGWVTQLADGKPVAGAQLGLLPDMVSGTSGADGTATLELPGTGGSESRVLIAKAGTDLVMLPESQYGWQRSSSWQKRTLGERTVWFVFDDRKLYKPKEEVRLKGWLRRVDFSRTGGTLGAPAGATKVRFKVRDSRGNEIASGETPIAATGGFDLAFKLPDNANLGGANVTLDLEGASAPSHWHSFQIQEFRRPEFEVSSKVSEGPHFVGGFADITAKATYFAGGGLANADINWRVTASPSGFVPPKQGKYTFGGAAYTPFLGWGGPYGGRSGGGRYGPPPSVVSSKSLAGKTDGAGAHQVRVHFDALSTPRTQSVNARATLQDVNRQTWTTSSLVTVHPASLYVGLRTPRYFYEQGKPIVVSAIVSDLDGKLQDGRPVALRAVRFEGKVEKGQYKEVEVDAQACSVKSTAKEKEPATCTFETRKGGVYQLTADITDDKGRPNRTILTRWVSGGKMPSKQRVEMEEVKLIADRDKYEPGQVAEILVVAPFSPAEGLMTLRRSGVLKKERFSISGGSHVLRVPIEDVHMPQLTVQVDLVGSAPRVDDKGAEVAGAPRRPAIASGSLSLTVPTTKRKLTVELKPREERTEPGAETSVQITVKDAAGNPVVDSEVALIIVDESVLALTGYRIGGVLNAFYPHRGPGVTDAHMRTFIALEDPRELLNAAKKAAEEVPNDQVMKRAMGGAMPAPSPAAMAPGSPAKMKSEKGRARGEAKGDKDGDGLPDSEAAAKGGAIAVRTDFRALALFAPAVKTGADGTAQVAVKLPDNLTRYRIMAVAVAGENLFGEGDSALTARLPLMVKPSAPRFLNFGDKFELPVVVQNQTDGPLEVKLAVRGANLAFTAGLGRTLTVPANDRVEVRFPAAAMEAGRAGFQVAGASGKWSDAAEVSMPVWTPATTEAFATYGTIDTGAIVQPVKYPRDVITEFGGLEITTSSTELQALTDAVLYLVSYPFECAEQRSSRILAIAGLKDVLSAFKAKGLPEPEKIVAQVQEDLNHLGRMQNADGGFPFWTRGYPSWPFVSIHVTHALVRADKKKFSVNASTLKRALEHLKNIERYIPNDYGEHTRRAIRAYSVYVRGQAGDNDLQKARELWGEIKDQKEPPLELIAWLYGVLSRSQATAELEAIRRIIKNKITETAAAAHFAAGYGDGDYLLLYSDRRLDAIFLEALIEDQPKSDLIVKIVRGLLAHRTKGRWSSTQENAWVLLAMDKYFNTFEGVTPDFVARAWLGERFAGEHAFKGRTTERHLIEIPMKTLAEVKEADLIIGKKGAGRLYYRVGMRYAPSDLRPPPAEHGFTVERRYEAMDDAKDVSRDKDGAWRVKAGARVRTTVTMVAPTRRYHVALVDPLPAGFETINGALLGGDTSAGAAKQPTVSPGGGGKSSFRGRGHFGMWWRPWQWFEHQNLRDERAEAFTSLLWAGVHTYSYTSRATTPGTFVVPPPKAEEMYHPETFGRGAGDKVIVE